MLLVLLSEELSSTVLENKLSAVLLGREISTHKSVFRVLLKVVK